MKLDRVSNQSNLKLEKAYQLQMAQCCLVELSLHVDTLFVVLKGCKMTYQETGVIILRNDKGQFIKGCTIAMLNKGIKKPEGFGEKISKTRMGIKLSSATKEKIAKGHIGIKPTLESRLKNSKTNKRICIKGKNHKWWKGGKSKNYKEGYYSAEYKQWRLQIFERDFYKCQGCNKVGGYLTAHHIKSWAKYPKLRFDINNGITLCEDCHKLTDNYKGRGKK